MTLASASDLAKLPAEELMLRDDFSLTEIWNALQVIQADVGFGQELAVYYTTPAWRRARTVLDLGTGNGHYLARLASHFGDKRYIGIDSMSPYIDIATRSFGRPPLTFRCLDLYQAEGRYDFVLARLVLQHLTAIGPALDRMADLLAPGGAALVIDAHDAVRHFSPEPEEFMAFFRAYAANQTAEGRHRDAAGELPALVHQHPRLRCAGTSQIVIPSSVGNNLELFAKTYYLVILMAERTGRLRYDFERVKQGWRRWYAHAGNYMHVGIRMVHLEHREGFRP